MTGHPSELLKAYQDATGIPISLSPTREHVLSDLHKRGITPEDVTAVMNELARLIRSGSKNHSPICLDFRRAMEPDVMEERAMRLRMAKLRKRGPVPDVTHERALGPNVVRFLAPQEASQEVPQADIRAVFSSMKDKLKGIA